MDTILAPATARGRAGVAVLRVSGPKANAVAEALAGKLPRPRVASLCRLRDPEGQVLDEALVLRFEAGASFTGQDVIEFHLHGGIAVVRAVQQVISDIPGCRLAEPGEFTRLALENGRLDLSEVEGLADLIDAETEGQRQQALRVLTGAAADVVSSWREDLVSALALLEATIDFADEEVPVDVRPDVERLVAGVLKEVGSQVEATKRAERVRDGFEVAILGAPNVGKSTLLNALSGRAAAITSEVAGTTRDVIEVRMDVEGLAVTFLDTAGLRETNDSVERVGIERAIDRAQHADLRIFLLDKGDKAPEHLLREDDLILGAKADLSGSGVSGLTGQGVDQLMVDVAKVLENRVPKDVSFSRERHRIALMRAQEELSAVVGAVVGSDTHDEVLSEHIWAAVRALESILGKVDIENVLDDIFSRFCLGK